MTPVRSAVAANGPLCTELRVVTTSPDNADTGQVTLRISRILRPGDSIDANHGSGHPCLSATWRLPDGASARGVFTTARYARV